ncbi:MAG TPA: prolyl oligopeptidase family serine peptidase [Gemmatimonadaceae bacterium]|jgi:dipeptidyl aminopeptidase/acylaminoacyl peptidase|nr:prolyl oligopeptidase family serine peptidase [Gemmatimonadaceae bacterium]
MRSRSLWAATLAFRRVSGMCALQALPMLARGQTPRPMTVDDVISLQSINSVVPSPNGEWLAVVIKRSGGPPDDRDADVWLVPRHGGTPRNLTGSAERRTQWSNPIWSPDGIRLAVLARTADGRVAPYIWMMRDASLRPLIDRDVDTHAVFDRSRPGTPILWLDSVTVLGAFWQRGAYPSSLWGSIRNTERAAQEGWAKTEAGTEPAVSVLESGRDTPMKERPQGQLLRIDVRTGESRVVAEGYFWQIILDPMKRHAALIVDAGRISPSEGRRLRYVNHFFATVRRTRLAIARLDSITPVEWIDAIRDPRIPEDGGEPHNWSPDGSMLAVVAKDDSSEAYGTTAYLISAENGTARRLTDRDLAVSATAWIGSRTVLALAQRTVFAAPGIDTSRYDWWRIDAQGDASTKNGTNITSGLADVPSELQATSDTGEMLGLAGGRLISINGGRAREAPVRASSDSSPFSGLDWSWPSRTTSERPSDELFAQAANGDFYAIALNTHATPRLVPRPTPEANLVAADPAHHLTVFTAAERTGTTLWVGDGETTRFDRKIALNQKLREIADAKRMLINYVGADGDSLKALILLPIEYIPGRRYPLVAFVYGGVMVQDTVVSDIFDKQSVSGLNLSLIPAHGYALLIPSVPVSPEGEAGDPMIDIPKGVLAAIDEATRIGVADPARVGIMGQSFGGYSTYSVITYTHRFRAAVVLAGFDNLPSLYGDIDPGARYSDFGYEMQHIRGLFEAGQLRMGTSPWSNLWRYLRNSPYYFADRVQTPVMIIQGDMDFVGIEQGDEFFSALYRMGKPVTFVRYWGEGHVIERSPANVRDMWHRIFSWFDEHFAVKQGSARAGGDETAAPSARN